MSLNEAEGAAVDDRRFALKRATNAAHARVEGVVQAAGMFNSQHGYRRYLQATWEMRAAFEDLLDRHAAGQLWTDWPRRRIAGLVAEDIGDLGGAGSGCQAGAPSPLTENFSRDLKSRELAGILYVLEGSSLGARILVKQAADMGLTASFGARHLHRQAADRDAWRSFMAFLHAAPEPPCHHAANQTFDAFARAYLRHATEAAV